MSSLELFVVLWAIIRNCIVVGQCCYIEGMRADYKKATGKPLVFLDWEKIYRVLGINKKSN